MHLMKPKSPQQRENALQNIKINFFQDLNLVHRPVCNLATEAKNQVGEKILKMPFVKFIKVKFTRSGSEKA